jgi:SAM-dependent methyltransferase
MVSDTLLALARCPECRGPLDRAGGDLHCPRCRTRSGRIAGDFLDLRPQERFAETTRYVEASLHADARHETVSPPLLGAGLRNDMLRAFLRPAPSDRVIDLGCGNGRTLVWNRDRWGHAVGVDVSPFFAEEAARDVDLVLGDLRRLPFPDGAFTKACTLDVLEHLTRDTVEAVLREAARVLEPGGMLFVYSHVRRNSRLAIGLRLINRLAARLERAGLIDLRQEHLRKSDHVNPLADMADLEAVCQASGFRLARVTYYTPLAGAFIENILMRVAERALARRHERSARPAMKEPRPEGESEPLRQARRDAKARIARRGPTFHVLRALTMLARIDVWLFGRVRSGPFFALLVNERHQGIPT